jgi:hypothetical protein
MRAAIRQKLLDAIPGLSGRVYEPHEAGAETPKPYAVLVQGEEQEDTPWTGFRRIIEVWPYVSRTSFANVDDLADQITAALDKQLLTDAVAGETFSCMYIGTASSDVVDEERDAITRGLRFAVVALQPVNVPETAPDDPWLEALAMWTESQLGAEWTVYRGLWPLGYVRPAVMWRIAAAEVQPLMAAAFEVRKQFVGHVIGRTPNEQTEGVLRIVEQLGASVKVPLDAADRRYLTILEPRADLQANAMSGGQISVTLSRRTDRPTEEGPLITGIHQTGQLR